MLNFMIETDLKKLIKVQLQLGQ